MLRKFCLVMGATAALMMPSVLYPLRRQPDPSGVKIYD